MPALKYAFPVSGKLSDRFGRRTLLMIGAGGIALLGYPLMRLMSLGTALGIMSGQMGLAVLQGTFGGALPATMAELAPWRVRCTVLSIGYNVGTALLGGTAPLMAEWLVARTGMILAPSFYLAAAGAVAFVAAFFIPRVAPHPLTREFASVAIR